MIVAGPSVPQGQTVDEPVSTLDLASTFYDLSGSTAGLPQHGTSLHPFLEGHAANREFAMNEWYLSPKRAGVDLALRTVRTKTHKLTIDKNSGVGEMYDLMGDPDEMINLFDDLGSRKLKNRLVAFINSRSDDMQPLRENSGGG